MWDDLLIARPLGLQPWTSRADCIEARQSPRMGLCWVERSCGHADCRTGSHTGSCKAALWQNGSDSSRCLLPPDGGLYGKKRRKNCQKLGGVFRVQGPALNLGSRPEISSSPSAPYWPSTRYCISTQTVGILSSATFCPDPKLKQLVQQRSTDDGRPRRSLRESLLVKPSQRFIRAIHFSAWHRKGSTAIKEKGP